MKCLGCGRELKTQLSKECGYGPVCYKKIFGCSIKTRASNESNSSSSEFPYYEIPGQMTLDDYLKENS